MTSEQNYEGKENSASSVEQTGENAPQTANSTAKQPLSADVRQRFFVEAQTKLLELVDDLMDGASALGPIEVINDLLCHWLTTPQCNDLPVDLGKDINRVQLFRAVGLVNFLAKAYEQTVLIERFEEPEKAEVQNG